MDISIDLILDFIENDAFTDNNITYKTISHLNVKRILIEYDFDPLSLEKFLFKHNVIPKRFLRNIATFGVDGQLKLLNSKVCVVGAGGLGGTVSEILVRSGIGELVIVDYDRFSDSNLNRQTFSDESNLEKEKVLYAHKRLKEIRYSTKIKMINYKLTEHNVEEIISGSDIVVDALDNIKTRFLLEKTCKTLGIPMVHAAISGFNGQVMTIYPEDEGLSRIYGDVVNAKEKGEEQYDGTPSSTPYVIASLQAQEVLKVLLNKGEVIRNKLLYIDLLKTSFDLIDF